MNENKVLRLLLLIFLFCAFIFFSISCVVITPTSLKPHRPSRDIQNVIIIGDVRTSFLSVQHVGIGGGGVSHINRMAYDSLLSIARQEHGRNVDVVDIFWTSFRVTSDRRLEYTAVGTVISLSGRAANETTGLETALQRAAEEISENFTARTRIAIVFITAQDRSITEFITGELEHILRRQGYIIIDRSELDRIRREQNLQMSGEVDEETALSIGRFSGANIILTGRVDGEGNLRRLRLRALDTQTAQVVGTASERL